MERIPIHQFRQWLRHQKAANTYDQLEAMFGNVVNRWHLWKIITDDEFMPSVRICEALNIIHQETVDVCIRCGTLHPMRKHCTADKRTRARRVAVHTQDVDSAVNTLLNNWEYRTLFQIAYQLANRLGYTMECDDEEAPPPHEPEKV